MRGCVIPVRHCDSVLKKVYVVTRHGAIVTDDHYVKKKEKRIV